MSDAAEIIGPNGLRMAHVLIRAFQWVNGVALALALALAQRVAATKILFDISNYPPIPAVEQASV